MTVAAMIERDGRFLMVEEETPDGVRLNQPAGHLEPGESIVDGCAREALEETAHPFTPTALLGVYMSRYTSARTGNRVTYLRFAFAGNVGDVEAGRALDDGILRAVWLSADEIRGSRIEHRSHLVMRCIEDFVSGQRFPLQAIHVDPSALGQ